MTTKILIPFSRMTIELNKAEHTYLRVKPITPRGPHSTMSWKQADLYECGFVGELHHARPTRLSERPGKLVRRRRKTHKVKNAFAYIRDFGHIMHVDCIPSRLLRQREHDMATHAKAVAWEQRMEEALLDSQERPYTGKAITPRPRHRNHFTVGKR